MNYLQVSYCSVTCKNRSKNTEENREGKILLCELYKNDDWRDMPEAGVTSSLLKRVNMANSRIETVVILAELAKEAGVPLELNRETINELEEYVGYHEQSRCEDVCGCFVKMVEGVKDLLNTPPDSVEELFEATAKIAKLSGIEHVIFSQLSSRVALTVRALEMVEGEDGHLALEKLLEAEYGVEAQVVLAGSDKAMALEGVGHVCDDGYPATLEAYFRQEGAEVIVTASQSKLYPWFVALNDAINLGKVDDFKALLKDIGWSLRRLPQKPKEYTTVTSSEK